MGAFEDGQAFLAGVLAKVPEALRAQVKEALEKPEARDAVVLLGDGVLARSDYSKHMDALKKTEGELATQKTSLHDWYTQNEAALKEYLVIKPEYDVLKTRRPADDDDPPPADDKKDKIAGLTKAEIEAMISAGLGSEVGGMIEVAGYLGELIVRHREMFGEVLSARDVTGNPKLGKPIVGQPGRIFSLQDAYNEKYGERVATKQKEAHDKQIEDEVQKRLGEERAKQVGQPFPLRDASPSVLDVLTTKDGSAGHTLDSAVAEYERLQAGRV